MHYFTIEQRDSLQAQLTASAARLRGEIDSALRQSGDPAAIRLANHFDEVDDRAVADLEASLDIAAVERDLRELALVEGALARIHTPEFGICDDCDVEIPFSRLQANPGATRCIHCQEKSERNQRPGAPSKL